jgi:hypothetical protein
VGNRPPHRSAADPDPASDVLRERRALLQETAREDLRRAPVILESNDVHRVAAGLQPRLQHRGENAAHLMQRRWSYGRRDEIRLCHDPG